MTDDVVLEARAYPTEYLVTVLPQDDQNASTWSLKVAWRGNGRWAVLRGDRFALSRQGGWDYERVPSERSDEWLNDHRFDVETALFLAEQHAPTVVVNGMTATEVLAMTRDRETS